MHTVNMSSIEYLLKQGTERLLAQAHLTYSAPALEARLLLQHVLGKSHAYLITQAQQSVSKSEALEFECLLAQRLQGKPIAYILGTQDFWSLTLKVAPCTLIPRQDTEILVEAVLELKLAANAKVLDLGTGTGAIALALAKERADWSVRGIDKVSDAVALATENAQLNNLSVKFEQSDWFSALSKQSKQSEQFDLIVSNPPYVEQGSDYLQQGDLRFEPASALSSGEDGLDDIRLIASQAYDYLLPHGYLVLEHGSEQATSVQAILLAQAYTNISTQHDYNGLARVTLAQKTLKFKK